MWLERQFEGDRNARIKLDEADLSGVKLIRRGGKFASWAILSLWTGFTFVGYFTPIKTVWSELWAIQLGPWEAFWIFFYAGFTYLMAGHMREQVCKYMCPYARFQGVMFDADTLIITYDGERGEPRGPRSKKVDYKAQGMGDCVDCDLCVAVCPTGIDIRKGLQYECIGCAACIDACDQVMDKMGYPQGLIRYSTEHAIEEHWDWAQIVRHVIRPRVILYSAILFAIIVAFIWGLATKPSLRVDVIRDRGALAREADDGRTENVFRLQIMNVSEQAQKYAISVSGLDGIQLIGEPVIELNPGQLRSDTVQVRVAPETGKKGSNQIFFDVKSVNDEKVAVHEKSIFIQP